jgi:hypothetical protein
MYIARRMEAKQGGALNKCVQCGFKVLICCVQCFERFIKFINRNAYIQIALQGFSFCKAAREAFFIILRNAGRFLTLGSIGGAFQFLGKWMVCLASTFIGYIIITHSDMYEDKLHSPVFPVIMYFIISYVIAGLFMSIYSVACDAIMHCYLVDEELMKKENRAPQHAPDPLIDFMNVEKEKEHKSCCC